MRRRRLLRWLAALTAGGLITLLVAAWWMGGALMAPANRRVGAGPADLPIEASTLASASGSQLATWYIGADKPTATVVLLHPIRASRPTMLDRARLLHNHGYAVVMIDFQAHGESPGEAITAGYLERHDAVAAVEYARRKHPELSIAVVGRSLGGASALLASPLGMDALVLESVYPTIDDAVFDRVAIRLGGLSYVLSPLLLAQLQPRLGISTADLRPIDHIAEVGCPVLVMSGDLDQHTTLDETRRLFNAAAEPKQLHVFAGAAHVDLLAADRAGYVEVVLGFLERHLGAAAEATAE